MSQVANQHLTDEEYVAKGGGVCPACGSDQIEGLSKESAMQTNVTLCKECHQVAAPEGEETCLFCEPGEGLMGGPEAYTECLVMAHIYHKEDVLGRLLTRYPHRRGETDIDFIRRWAPRDFKAAEPLFPNLWRA